MDQNENSLGTRLNDLRKQKGWSMDELAKMIIIPKNDQNAKPIAAATINNIEKNKNVPSVDIVLALSEIFNVSIEWLLTGKKRTLEQEIANEIESYDDNDRYLLKGFMRYLKHKKEEGND